jgi:PIN domain nuclease of toxin-antitoxin system
MRLLLDTHVLLWVLDGSPLRAEAHAAIASPHNDVLVSAASIWEMSIKAERGRLELPADWFAALEQQSIDVLDITTAHARAVGLLPPHHRDPFARMLVAQAANEGLVLVSRDAQLSDYDVPLLVA